jgi:hypothetical protein
MKYVASAQDVICEQWIRPSHVNDEALSVIGALNCEEGAACSPLR